MGKETGAALEEEFSTVSMILSSQAITSRVDAFALTWIKTEKQLRRLFAYLVFRHPQVSIATREEYVSAMVENKNLSFETLIECVNALSARSLSDMLGSQYGEWRREIERIRGYRNKILHGQLTGKNLTAKQLERDIHVLQAWIEAVARSCSEVIGYDGITRNTYIQAKRARYSESYPFNNAREFRAWLPRKR